MATLRPCLDCGETCSGTRCVPCGRTRQLRLDQQRGGATARGYSAGWERLRRKAVKLQGFCADCGGTVDLTGDHLIWPACTLDDVAVLCRSCNSRKGAVRHGI